MGSYSYDPFGRLNSSSGILSAQAYRFSTKEYHERSGIYYFGFRYYIPDLGRWLNRDPIEENGGINLFMYIGNNPLNKIDLLGLWKKVPRWRNQLACILAVGARYKQEIKKAEADLDSCLERCQGPCDEVNQECIDNCIDIFDWDMAILAVSFAAWSAACLLITQ